MNTPSLIQKIAFLSLVASSSAFAAGVTFSSTSADFKGGKFVLECPESGKLTSTNRYPMKGRVPSTQSMSSASWASASGVLPAGESVDVALLSPSSTALNSTAAVLQASSTRDTTSLSCRWYFRLASDAPGKFRYSDLKISLRWAPEFHMDCTARTDKTGFDCNLSRGG